MYGGYVNKNKERAKLRALVTEYLKAGGAITLGRPRVALGIKMQGFEGSPALALTQEEVDAQERALNGLPQGSLWNPNKEKAPWE